MKKKQTNSFLPHLFLDAHALCFINHDILVQLLASGEKHGQFWHHLRLNDDEDKLALEAANDVFDWLEETGRTKERTEVLRTVVFPALLSDFLHFVYEALETAKKAKLNVTFSLLRKPLQETLYVFETMLTDIDSFGNLMVDNPVGLHSQKAGGLEVHKARIRRVLDILDENDRFDASYISQLRYDKSASDGFDGVFNTAIHLFTSHTAIRTESLNINFVFSDWDAKMSQWQFLYNRLPYLIVYARLLIERLFSTFSMTWPDYLEDMERRVSASILLWSLSIPEKYLNDNLSKFIEATRSRLAQHCRNSGFREPTHPDLLRMRLKGAFPGESVFRLEMRNLKYAIRSKI